MSGKRKLISAPVLETTTNPLVQQHAQNQHTHPASQSHQGHHAHSLSISSNSSALSQGNQSYLDSPTSFFAPDQSFASRPSISVAGSITPTASGRHGSFAAFNMSSIFSRGKQGSSSEKDLKISAPRPRVERQESHNISPGSAYPPAASQAQQQSTNPNTAASSSTAIHRTNSISEKPGSSSSDASNYFPYQPIFHSREDSQDSSTFPYGMNMAPLGDHRRDLKVLQGPGGGANGYSSSNPTLTQTPPSASPTGQTWKAIHHSSSFGSNPHDSSFGGVPSVLDDMAKLSGSPEFKQSDIFSPLNMDDSPQAGRNGSGHPGSMDFSYSGNSIDGYYTPGDDRRPSVASVNTTASSTGSKTSLGKRLNGKLHGIFGDAEGGHHNIVHHPHPQHSSTIPITPPPVSQSDTNLPGNKLHYAPTAPVNNPSRPRTPQPPSSDVVPFLFQDANDIQTFGEARIQPELVHDRHRYHRDEQNVDPKSSAHNFFNKKGKTPGKPSSGRDYDGGASDRELPQHRRDLFSSSYGNSTTNLPRASSPSPSLRSLNSGMGSISNAAGHTAASTTGEKATKRSFLKGMLRGGGKKAKDEEPDVNTMSPVAPRKDRHPSIKVGEPVPSSARGVRQEVPKRGTTAPLTTLGNTTPSGSKTKKRGDSFEKPLGKDAGKYSNVVLPEPTGNLLDIFDLTNMEGIVAQSPAPAHPSTTEASKSKQKQETHGSWNAPDSWAVGGRQQKVAEAHPQEEVEEIPEEILRKQSLSQFCIRVFRVDGSFTTLSSNINSTVTDLLHQLGKKSFLQDDLSNYVIILRKGELARILGSNERPLIMQKKLLEQVGYNDEDRVDEIGREDNSYLCRFTFLPSRVSGHSLDPDTGFNNYKYNHVDLSGRNLLTIPIAFYHKANEISSLNLSRNLSLQVPQDFIQACTNLKEVKFRNNEAWDLPSSFAHISRLTYMDISNNRLKNLGNARLHRHESLVALKMANNRIQELPEEFSKFHNLRGLNVASNYLNAIPPLVSKLVTLVELDLSFNKIKEIPEEISSLKALERLILSHNQIAGDLPAGLAGLRALKELDIRHNNLISVDVLGELDRLETLYSGHNEISAFTCGFERIRTLHLNSSKVTAFTIKSITPTLTYLNLSDNKMTALADNFCDMLPNLEKLVLDKNKINSLPPQIGKLKKLIQLSCASNHLTTLPTEIGQLIDLRVLDLHDNDIAKLPSEIWSMISLTSLNLSSNVLTAFPKLQTTQVPAVQSQPANDPVQSTETNEYNPLQVIHETSEFTSNGLLSAGSPNTTSRKGSFASVNNALRKASIASKGSDVSTVVGTGTFTPQSRKDSTASSRIANTFASSLRFLYLADNRLGDEVFDEVSLLSELRVLNLSYNRIYDIPSRALTKLVWLNELYLSGNELTSLPTDDLEHIASLKVLHLNSNKFQTLPAELGKIRRLHVLDVGSNALKYNISNWPYDWNWNWNLELRYLNLSGNRRLEIKANFATNGLREQQQSFTDFNALKSLRVLGLMDVTTTNPSFPDQSEDCRVRTSGTQIKNMMYGMADSLGRSEHLSMVDMVVPRFRGNEDEVLFGFYDGQTLPHSGSKVAKFLQEQTIFYLTEEMRKLRAEETPAAALRRAFLAMNRELMLTGLATHEEKTHSPRDRHRGTNAGVQTNLTRDDIQLGATAALVYIKEHDMYIANVGDAMGLLVQTSGEYKLLTKKHDPLSPSELERIRDAGGYVSRSGRVNDHLEISRAFGYLQLIPSVQACPSVEQWKITEADEFLILASKELWDHMSYQTAVYIANQEKGDLMLAAQKLRDFAIGYGATNKIMVMIVEVGGLVKQRRRVGRSTSIVPGMDDDARQRGARPRKGDLEDDSRWRKFGREIPPPEVDVCLVFTDIKGSTLLWETYPIAMRSAIKSHNDIMREQLRLVGGYEVKTEGDAFMVAFPTVTSALLWTFNVQLTLLSYEAWPPEILRSQQCAEVWASDPDGVKSLVYRGLSVRMGIHFGQPVCERDPITKRMDYFGPMVNRAARIEGVADGGQIAVSMDYLTELKKVDALYPHEETATASKPNDSFGDVTYEDSIRNDLRNLRNANGWIIKPLGEKKLKGLENPEIISLMIPPSLAGRESDKLIEKSPPSETGLTPEMVLPLYDCTLRLEKLCSQLNSKGLMSQFILDGQYSKDMLQKKIQEGGTDPRILEFVEYVITRIESSITTLYLRSIMKNVPNVDDNGPEESGLGFGSSITSILSSLRVLLESDPRLQIAKSASSSRSNSNASAVDSTVTDDFPSEDYDDCEINEAPFANV
ncbi:cysteinyl-tRNA synthetase [Orbilia oligospora]|uniref:Adenylate cyclase n=1 Tax=Orbilia oligospora TaxID=2813651 RepID=A0A6G1MQ94_ORBOL|nr:cysteinyl-tRNA synthetase, variant 2 [Orbilia oligospora]KAF3231275.1 cysteinyl-tRNA synthetase, variant 2 [Orbilia oligospora]KAF3265516.1 cysteinyl-tRNA synthetase [Orbilia oligospora]